MLGDLLKSVLAGVLAAALMFGLSREEMVRNAALTRALRARGERTSARVSARRQRKQRCTLELTGVTASGRAFATTHTSDCRADRLVGASLALVVLPDDLTQFLLQEELDARGADGTLPDEAETVRFQAFTTGPLVALFVGAVLLSRRRKVAAER